MSDQLNPRRVLIIDDNPEIHGDFRKILAGEKSKPAHADLDAMEAALFGDVSPAEPSRRGGYAVDSAFQGEEGYTKVRESLASGVRYPVAFVDMRMPPGWDGLTTIEKLWEVDPDLQVVICSAYSDHSWEQICDRFGTRDRFLMLKKPFESEEVCALAGALTEKWRGGNT